MNTNISAKIARLQDELKKARRAEAKEIQAELREARKNIRKLEKRLAQVRGRPATLSGRRKRTTKVEMEERIFGALSGKKKSSVAEIKEKAGLPYVSVYNFVNSHPDKIKATGEGRNRRYSLK